MKKEIKIIIERQHDGFVAYPLGLKGIVIGEGDTYEEALDDVKSAIIFHIETFVSEVFEKEIPILDVFVTDDVQISCRYSH